MKAILIRRTGGPSVLDYVEVPTPRPRDDEVLVRADTIGVSMPEVLVRKGAYGWMPPRLAEGKICPLIHARLRLAEACRAHEMLEAGEVIGKIVVKP